MQSGCEYLPQPRTKKKRRRLNLLPNTVTNIIKSITPSHNIQQKADMKKYCNNAATALQEIYQLHTVAMQISNQ